MNLDSLISQPKADTERSWSPMQSAIFDAVLQTKSNIIVEAVAGSGKTTTMVEAVNRLCMQGETDILCLAFNKSIAMELQKRLPSVVTASTFHALGLSTFPNRPKVNGGKCRKLLKEVCNPQLYEEHARDILRMVSLAKMQVGEVDLEELMGDFDVSIPPEHEKKALELVEYVLKQSIVDRKEIDFDDMLFLPVLLNHTFPTFKYIFVDELQDLNDIQHHFIKLLLAQDGRVIGVGDTNQAIYAFRGADSNSMNRFRQEFDPLELPLSISYRCPKSVVNWAQHIVPQIQYADDAIEGTVWYENPDSGSNMIEAATADDLILCRNNAPLFRLALAFLRMRKPVYVRGNFGEQLVSFVKGFKTKNIDVLRMRLDQWYTAEAKRLEDQQGKLGYITDKYESIKCIAAECDTVEDALNTIINLVTPTHGTILSSIHRAKGTEAKRVIFYLPKLLPSKYAVSSSQKQQEQNLKYVGGTRALEELFFIDEEYV